MSAKFRLRALKHRSFRWLLALPWLRPYLRHCESVAILRNRPRRTPDLDWEILPDGPCPRFDAGAIQIGSSLYCIGGYLHQNEVLSCIDIFDMSCCSWGKRITMTDDVPQSHFAAACEKDRFIYIVGGQLGARCSPSIATALVFDVQQNMWSTLPPLPEPRYAPTMQLYRNRLHLIGGAKVDRYTPAYEHWSIAVKDGRAIEDTWRLETPIPRGGMHRASIVFKDDLYVFGGQEGDFTPVADDPLFTCNPFTVEHVYADVFRWEAESQSWTSLPPMPVPVSHTEFSVCTHNNSILISGGSKYKDPQSFDIELTDVVQVFDTQNQEWEVQGHLPYRTKTCLTAIYDGWLYVTSGQRDQGVNDPRPGEIDNRTWRARLP